MTNLVRAERPTDKSIFMQIKAIGLMSRLCTDANQ